MGNETDLPRGGHGIVASMRRLEPRRRSLAGGDDRRRGALVALAVFAMLAAGCSGTSSSGGSFELASDTPSPEATVAIGVGDEGDAESLRVLADDDGQGVDLDVTDTNPTTTASDTSSSTSPDPTTSTASSNTASSSTASPNTASTSTAPTSSSTVSTLRATTSSTGAATTVQQTTTTRQTMTTSELPPPSGDVIYVDSSASSGGNGSQGAPYNTLTKGLDEVKAGQTLIVKGGEYRERIQLGVGGKNTSSSRRILVQAAPGERVVVKGLLNLYNIDYWTIRGINVTWDDRNSSSEHMVLLKNGRDWVFEQAEVWGARGYSGLLIVGSPVNFTVRDVHVHDTYRSNGTHQDHLIYCNCGSGGGVIERNLLVGSSNGRGIKVGTPNDSYPSIANVKIRYNTIVDNTGPSNIQLSYKTSNITIERNLLVSPKDGLSNVTGRHLSGGGNNIVRNNIGWDSAGVVENADKLTDGGGNRQIDPRLDGNYVPTNPDATSYGHRAP